MNGFTISLTEGFKTAINSMLSDIYTCLPGKIVRIANVKRRRISVRPELQKVFLDETVLDPPIIENVPLLFTGTSDAIVKFPINVGDKVLLMFAQRSIDNWLSKGDLTTPGSKRKFDLSDAFAIPGVQAFNENHQLITDNNNLEIIFDNKIITFVKDGVLKIDSKTDRITIMNTAEDLATLISDLIDTIINLVTVGSPTTQTLDPATKVFFQTMKTRFSNLLE